MRMASSRVSFFFFLYSFIFHLVALTVAQQQPVLQNICLKDEGTFSRNSIYQANLKRVLSSLASNPRINNGFYKASYGAGENQVKAMALCRGDVKPTAYRRCIYSSSFEIQKSCPNQKEAVVWYDNCMLRYSKRYFFGNMEFGPWFYMYNLKIVPNPSAFTRALTSLLTDLKYKAASGDSRLKYATGSTATS